MKSHNLIVLVLFGLLFISSNSYAQQQRTTISHKPKETGYEFSVDVIWNIIPCYGKIKVNIAVDLDNIDIKAYHYKGKSYTPSDIGMSSFKSNIRIVDLSAYVIYGQMNYGELLMKNVNNYTNAGCYGQTFEISEMLTLSSVQDYIDNIGQFRLQDIHITNDAFIDHILNAKIKELEKEEQEEKEENNNIDDTDDFWDLDAKTEVQNQNEESFLDIDPETETQEQNNEDFWSIDTEVKTQKQKDEVNSDIENIENISSENIDVLLDSRDGKEYNIVKIGNQTWMAENLNYNISGSWCYDDKTNNCDVYGRLYNFESANIACPSGWHLSSSEEWVELSEYLGGLSVCGSKLKETGTTHWTSPNDGAATNEAGFAALPGGYRNYNGEYDKIGDKGFWWSSRGYGSNAVYYNLGSDNIVLYWHNKSIVDGLSVRCIKD